MLRKILKLSAILIATVILFELTLTGLFFAGVTADERLIQPRFEQVSGLGPLSEIIVDDGVPHRSAGYDASICEKCGSPKVVTEYDDEGMRLDGFNGAAKCNVAVFGDGYTNAVELSDEDVFTSRAERQLRMDGYDVNLMNFGLRNAGTTPQYLHYRQLIDKGYKFDYVVLMVNPVHNVVQNSRKLNWWEYEQGYPYLVLENGELVRHDGDGRPLWQLRRFLKNYSHIGTYARRELKHWRLAQKAEEKSDSTEFTTPIPPSLEEAWQVTEKVLGLWAAQIRAEGSGVSAFILELGSMAEPTAESDYRRHRMQAILDALEIENVDVLPDAVAYIKAHALQPPYLSYAGWSHYGPDGHRLLAEEVIPVLRNRLSDCRADETPSTAAACDIDLARCV